MIVLFGRLARTGAAVPHEIVCLSWLLASGSNIIYSPTAWERVEHGKLVCTDTIIPQPWDPWVLLARWLLPQTGGTLWRTASVGAVGGWRAGQPCCQEHELYLRLLAA